MTLNDALSVLGTVVMVVSVILARARALRATRIAVEAGVLVEMAHAEVRVMRERLARAEHDAAHLQAGASHDR